MAYYYNSAGYKVPVDDNSTPEEKDAAAKQEQNDARAAAGDNSTNGDPNGVKAPGAAGQVDSSGKVVDGPTGNTQGTANNPQQRAADAAAAAAAAQQAAAQKAAIDAANAHFQYGGYTNGANDAASRYRQEGEDAQKRQAGPINYTQADLDRGASYQAREGQKSAADMLLGRANGSVPLISNLRANQDESRALADQSSIAASARGPAALALAQQNQANNSASAISNISNNAQINGSQEQLNNTLAAGQAFSSMRAGDTTTAAQDAQKAQYQSSLDEAQRAENDKYQLGMTGAETDVQKAQLAAQGNQVAIAAGQANAQAARDQAASFHSDDRADKYIAPVVGAAATVGGGLLLGALGGGGGNTTAANSGVGGGSTTNPGGVNAGNNSLDPTTGMGVSGSGGGYNPDGSDPWNPNSDMRLKERVSSEGSAQPTGSRVDAFLDGIHPLSYHYKDAGAEPRTQPTGGRYLGISAQDLEAVPEVGKQMVSEGPRGKRIESGPTLSAALAGLARLHERVKELEGGGAAMHRNAPTHRNSSEESLGPSGEDNRDEPDYNYIKNPSPLNVSYALEQKNGSISPQTEAYMRREGMWGQKTDSLLRERHLDRPDVITSDMAAKTDVATEGDAPYVDPRAKAWDEGHNEALNKVQQYRQMTPEQLKELGDKGNRLANAVRGAKADAWDEAHGRNQSMTPSLIRQPTSFQRERPSTVDTALSPQDETAFKAWKQQYAPNDSGGDYDLRGAYQAGIKPDPQSGHWPDTFKKPNHPTFSDESQYAKQGRPGHWNGETFTPAEPTLASLYAPQSGGSR